MINANTSIQTGKLIFLLSLIILFFLPFYIYSQSITCKVDMNVPDRHEDEVNEPGYTPWPVTTGPVDSITIDGVTYKLNGIFRTGWYKAGVQAPYYARLANDGMLTGVGVQLIISELPAGQHTLLTFHNTFSNPESYTFSPMDIYLNDSLVVDDLIRTNRVLSNTDANTAYFKFEVDEGEDVIIEINNGTSLILSDTLAQFTPQSEGPGSLTLKVKD